MLKRIIPAVLLLSVNSAWAESLLISGRVEASSAQTFTPPQLDTWQVKIDWMEEEGKQVKAGDPVVVFDTNNIASEVEQLEANLRKVKSERERKQLELDLELRQAEFDVEKALLELKKAQVDANIPETHISQYQFAQYQLELEKAQKSHEEASKKLAIKQKDIKAEEKKNQLEIFGAEKELNRKQSLMDAMSLKAKENGTVMYVEHPWNGTKIRAGDTVQRNFTVLKIPSTDELKVIAWLNEVDIAWLKPGHTAHVSLDAIPGSSIKGKIVKIGSQGENRDHWGEAAYFEVEIELAENNYALLPGMSALARVEVEPQG